MWRSVLLGVVIAGVLAGCSLGSGSGASSNPSQTSTSQPRAGNGVRWMISYGVGQEQRRRAEVARCPTGAVCRVVQDRQVTFSNGEHGWVRIATRHLTCPTATGDCVDPTRACQVLSRLRSILVREPPVACFCPASLSIPGKAIAAINGRRVVVPLDFCTYCER
ncbi:MAG: hypothetical protein QOI39_2224, partial [Mycobacterium sp.]|nr:hypothetical protein [Mycobacterium sp.]